MNKKHWEHIYENKKPDEVSWTQKIPTTSLDLIAKFELPKNASIIDVGGGDSKLVDHLLILGYTNITVLDISGAAIARAKSRLGERANSVKWIEQDITQFQPTETYDLWHDRAVFHFLTNPTQIDKYVKILAEFGKNLVLGTFSVNGPKKCSGLDITQYDEHKIKNVFGKEFTLIESDYVDHNTPFSTTQNFIFARLIKK